MQEIHVTNTTSPTSKIICLHIFKTYYWCYRKYRTSPVL